MRLGLFGRDGLQYSARQSKGGVGHALHPGNRILLYFVIYN